MPCVFERLDLRMRFGTARRLEEKIVIGLTVEWRIQIDEIDRLILYLVAENRQVIAVVEKISRHPHQPQPTPS
jgi:hypothetical protein